MIRRLPFAAALLALVLLPASATAAPPVTHFRAHLTGAQEVPPTGSTATGTLDLRLTNGGTKLHFKLTSNGVTQITQAHIHVGAVGANGPVVVYFFAPPPAPWNSVTGDNFETAGVRTEADVHLPPGSFTFADLVSNLRSGNTYANIHSPTHPAGEIRGQIKPAGEGDD